MRLTAFTDYSLRVLIYLAADPKRRATIGEIAEAFEISEHHLVKVVHFLGQKGWLANVRGKGGGMVLAMAPEAIVVGQVVRDTERVIAPTECLEAGGGHCRIARVCRLRGVMSEALDAFHAVLDRFTLHDLVQQRAPLARILFKTPARLPAAASAQRAS
jgi:Rrf2 family transcriptional regulator, nitric oxide-sensitive transcriptional repressor